MLAPDALRRLLGGETDRVEYKESAQRDRILQAVCALANDLANSGQAGYVLVGVDDRGSVRGVDPTRLDEQQRELADWLRSTKI